VVLIQNVPASAAEVAQECLGVLLELSKLPSTKTELCNDGGLQVLLQVGRAG
jgi:hypothetical protein